MKKSLAAVVAVMTAIALTACSGSGSTESAENTETTESTETSGDEYKIGILQLTQHPALDKANEGFIAALDDAGISYTVDQQNASGDQPTCCLLYTSYIPFVYGLSHPSRQLIKHHGLS